MNKKTKTTIVSVAILLGLALSAAPSFATNYPDIGIEFIDETWIWRVVYGYEKISGPEAVFEIVEDHEFPTCSYEDVLEVYRGLDCYCSEDLDYVYLDATRDSLVSPSCYLSDPYGDAFILLWKDAIEAIVNAGYCDSLP